MVFLKKYIFQILIIFLLGLLVSGYLLNKYSSASKKNDKLYIITKGSSGSLILHKGIEYISEAIPTEVISLNGAGDTFLGAFIGCYMETKDIQYSGNVANYFSYASVQENNACLKFSSLLNTKNAAKAAFL